MSSEIHCYYPSGNTLYACVRNPAGQVWYVAGQAFEAWGTGARTAADYDIALTGDAGDLYVGNFDTNIAAGTYYVQAFLRAGAGPADIDTCIGSGEIIWTGSAELLAGTALTAIKAETDKIPNRFGAWK